MTEPDVWLVLTKVAVCAEAEDRTTTPLDAITFVVEVNADELDDDEP